MKKNNYKDIILIFFVFSLLFIGIVLGASFILCMLYYFGVLVGFVMNVFIGIDVVCGITFPQLFGILTTFVAMILACIGISNKYQNKRIDTLIKEKLQGIIKKYRGY